MGLSTPPKNVMLSPLIAKNDRKFSLLIILLSCIIFIAIVILGRVKLDIQLGFDAHIFARINAIINSAVSVLLIAGLIAVKAKRYTAHRNIMLSAMILSALFL